MRRQRNLDVMNNRPVSENFSAINLHLNEDDNKTFSSHERINNYEINNNSVFNWPNHIQRKAHQAPTPVCYDQMMRDNHGSNRQFQRCFSEMPEVQSKYGECLKTDWYSNLLPYKLHPTSSTLTMHQIDSHPTRPPTRRMSRTNMAHRNIMTQSMIAYMPDDDSSNQSTTLDYTNVMDRNQNLSRISRTISTDRYSSDDVRPSLPSLTHLMSSMTSGESRQANHDNSQPNSSPDFLRDQKKFLNDVESRADSPRLDQYYRLFHVNSGRNQNASQKRDYSSKKNSSNLLNEGSFNDCTLKRKDYSSVAPVTRRPSRPTFVGI